MPTEPKNQLTRRVRESERQDSSNPQRQRGRTLLDVIISNPESFGAFALADAAGYLPNGVRLGTLSVTNPCHDTIPDDC